jgi:hypothetical protein
MKKLDVLALLYFSVSSTLSPQTATRPLSTVSLSLGGANVSIGMSRAEVRSRIAKAHLEVIADVDDGMILKQGYVGFTLTFKADRLTFASRSWNTKDDMLRAVMDALTAINTDEATTCQIQRSPIAEPTHSADRLFISCGERSVMLSKIRLGGKEIEMVEERIGD